MVGLFTVGWWALVFLLLARELTVRSVHFDGGDGCRGGGVIDGGGVEVGA